MSAEWLTPRLISEDGTYTLQPLETSDEAYQIILGGEEEDDSLEYLLLENRQQLEFDVFLPVTGLAVYHIDNAAKGQEQRGYPGQSDEFGNSWPTNGLHYQVAMLQADGLYELEQGIDRGDATDLWQVGQELGPGMGGTIFPNTDRYQGGTVSETNIRITVLEPEGNVVKFQVTGLGGGSNIFEQNSQTLVPSVAPTVNASSPGVSNATAVSMAANTSSSEDNSTMSYEGDTATSNSSPVNSMLVTTTASPYPTIPPIVISSSSTSPVNPSVSSTAPTRAPGPLVGATTDLFSTHSKAVEVGPDGWTKLPPRNRSGAYREDLHSAVAVAFALMTSITLAI
jgi:hypothetical protein